MTLQRRLDSVFTNPADLPLFTADLPVAGVHRRYVAGLSSVATGLEVFSLDNAGAGVGLVVAAVGKAPIIRRDTRTYLEFDGVDDTMLCATSDGIAANAAFTTYAVGRYRNAVNVAPYEAFGSHGSTYASRATGGALMQYRGIAAANSTPPLSPGTTWCVIINMFADGDGTAGRIRLNNSDSAVTVSPGTAAQSFLGLAWYGGGAYQPPAIDLAEFGVFKFGLDLTQRAVLATALMATYNIV